MIFAQYIKRVLLEKIFQNSQSFLLIFVSKAKSWKYYIYENQIFFRNYDIFP